MQCVLSPKCVKYILYHGITLSETSQLFFCTRVTCTWKDFTLLHVIWSTGNVQRQTNLLPICRITKRFLKKYASSLILKYKKKIHSEKGKDKKNHKKRITFRMILLKTIIYSIYLFKYSKWKQLGQG